MNNTYESNGDFSYNYIGNYLNDLLNKTNGHAITCNQQRARRRNSHYLRGWNLSLLRKLLPGIRQPALCHVHHGLRLLRAGQLEVQAATHDRARPSLRLQVLSCAALQPDRASGQFRSLHPDHQPPLAIRTTSVPASASRGMLTAAARPSCAAATACTSAESPTATSKTSCSTPAAPTASTPLPSRPTPQGAPVSQYLHRHRRCVVPAQLLLLRPQLAESEVHEFDLQIQQELGRGTFFRSVTSALSDASCPTSSTST